jgi:hypothetical protein
MSNQDYTSPLPPRLLRALWIWLATAALVALLPRGSSAAVGLLAHPAFWCGVLPLLAVLPYAQHCLPRTQTPPTTRIRRSATQARRRPRAHRAVRQVA